MQFYYHDKDSSSGRNAAIINGRIYFFSNEFGYSGIYSMDSDGSNLLLENEFQDIRQLTLYDDKKYCIALEEILPFEDSTDLCIVYAPYKIENNLIQKINYTKQQKYSAYEACFMDNDYSFIHDKFGIAHNHIDRLYILRNDQIINCLPDNIELVNVAFDESIYNIGTIGDYYIMTNNWPPTSIDDGYYTIDIGLVDKSSSTIVQFRQFDILTHFLDDNKLFISKGNVLYIVDAVSGEITENLNLTKTSRKFNDSVKYAYKHDNCIYSIIERREGKGIGKFKQDMVVSFDLNNKKRNIIKDTGGRIIFLDENCFIEANQNKLIKYSLKGNEITNTENIYINNEKFSKTHMSDYAGNWLFLYEVYEDPYKDDNKEYLIPIKHLICRINIKTNELVINQQEVDYSGLKAAISN